MKFAIGKRIITPRFSFVQHGFAARHDPVTKVHDELYATAAVLSANSVIVLITLDLISGDRNFEKALYAALFHDHRIPSDRIILSYSHTHGALGLGDFDGEEVPGFRDTVLGVIRDLVKETAEHLRESKMSFCRASSDFGICRRFPSPEGILLKPYDDPESADRDLYLLKFEDEDGLRAILWNYSCHPVSCGSDNLEVTADFPGAVRSLLEEKYPGAGMMFLQGCGADVNPVISVAGDSFVGLTPEQMTAGARRLADGITEAVNKGAWRSTDICFKAVSEEIILPCENRDRSYWEKIADDPREPEYRKTDARRAVEKYDRGELAGGLPFRIKCIRLSEGLRIVCLEDEIVSAYGRQIREGLAGDTVTLGYTGSICCYIPTARMLREGGYESHTFLSAGICGPFREELEELITSTACRLAENTRYAAGG